MNRIYTHKILISLAMLALLVNAVPLEGFGQATMYTVSGTVKNGFGQPIPDAEVKIEGPAGSTAYITHTDNTGSNIGKYSFTFSYNELYTLYMSTAPVTASKSGASQTKYITSFSSHVIINFTLGPPTNYTLTINLSPISGGMVDRNPRNSSHPTIETYSAGTVVTLTAEPNTGIEFKNWSGDASGTANPTTITMDSDKSVTANFDLAHYTLTVNVNNSSYGTVTKNPNKSSYTYGEQVTLTAIPAAGFIFSGWSGVDTAAGATATVIMNSDKTVTANFAQTCTLTITSAHGTVNRDPSGTVTDSPNVIIYPAGTIVHLTVDPAPGYIFKNWSGDANATTNHITIFMNSNKAVTANFTTVYTLAINSTHGIINMSPLGAVAANPNEITYPGDTPVTLTAVADAGWGFKNWSGSLSGKLNPTTLMMNSNKSVTANFTPIYTLTIISEHGTVNRAANPTDQVYYFAGDPGVPYYALGTQVTLSATANPGYVFKEWSGDASGTAQQITITMNGNKTVTANFKKPTTYFLTTYGSNCTVSKNPDQSDYTPGTDVELKAIPNQGYVFAYWSGAVSSKNNSIKITMDADKSISATCVSTALTIISEHGTVTKSPNKTIYDYEDQVKLTAFSYPGWDFKEWSGDASGTAKQTIITMNGPKTVTANYTPVYNLTVNIKTGNVVSSVGGTVTKNPDKAKYNSGSTVQLTATAKTGYDFKNWSVITDNNSNPITVTDNSTTITMNSNITATANFVKVYTLTTKVNNANYGAIIKDPGQAKYAEGTEVKLEAKPNEGHIFKNWSVVTDSSNITTTVNDNPTTITMNSNATATANFVKVYTLTTKVNNANYGAIIKDPGQAKYAEGTEVKLEAKPNEGHIFQNWSVVTSGSTVINAIIDNPTTITMNGDKTATAFFTPVYTLTVNIDKAGYGTVTKNPDKPTYPAGTKVTLKAKANPEYTFKEWSGDASGKSDSTTITMDKNKTVTANFKILNPLLILVEFDPKRITVGDYGANAKPDDKTQMQSINVRQQKDCEDRDYPEVAHLKLKALKLVDNDIAKTIKKNEIDASYKGSFVFEDLSESVAAIKQKVYVDFCSAVDYFTAGQLTLTLKSYLAVNYNGSLNAKIKLAFSSPRIEKTYLIPANHEGNPRSLEIEIPQYIDQRKFVYDAETRNLTFVSGTDGSPDFIQWMGYDIAKDPKNSQINLIKGADNKIFTAKDMFSCLRGIKVISSWLDGDDPAAVEEDNSTTLEVRGLPEVIKLIRNPQPFVSTYTGSSYSNSRTALFSHEFHHIFYLAVYKGHLNQVFGQNPDQDEDKLIAPLAPPVQYLGINLFNYTEDSKDKGFSGDETTDEDTKLRHFNDFFETPKKDVLKLVGLGIAPINKITFYKNTAWLKEVSFLVITEQKPQSKYYNLPKKYTLLGSFTKKFEDEPKPVKLPTRIGLKIRNIFEEELAKKNFILNEIPEKTEMDIYVETLVRPAEYDALSFAKWYETQSSNQGANP